MIVVGVVSLYRLLSVEIWLKICVDLSPFGFRSGVVRVAAEIVQIDRFFIKRCMASVVGLLKDAGCELVLAFRESVDLAWSSVDRLLHTSFGLPVSCAAEGRIFVVFVIIWFFAIKVTAPEYATLKLTVLAIFSCVSIFLV